MVENEHYTIFDGILIILFFLGLALLIWVGQLVLIDVTIYGKSVLLSLFGSRAGENVGLGIGALLVYYLIVGIFLLFFSLFLIYKKHKS